MKIYKLFTNEESNAPFAYALIVSVVVLANTEEEAKEIVKKQHGDNFVCDFNDIEVQVICEDINTPIIVAVDYYEN